MKNNEYFIEVSILSTVLFAHHQCKDEEYFNNLELKEEWFLIHFHKIIVRAINHNKAKALPIYEEFIADALSIRGQLDFELWTTIISANPFSKVLFEKYLETLQKPKTSLYYEV